MYGDQFLPHEPECFHPGFPKQFEAEFIGVIPFVNHPPDPRVDEHFRAGIAGLTGDVHRGPFAWNSNVSRLEEGILFGM